LFQILGFKEDNMNNQSTIISYANVKQAADKILSCSNTMNNIFEAFGNEIQAVGAEDVFTGDASESLGERFRGLKTKFEGYVSKIKEFSDAINAASSSTEQTEKKLASQAENLSA